MTTACGCPSDAGLHGPQHPCHAPEVCSGSWKPVWSCDTREGRVDVYTTCIVAVSSDPMTANPWGLWSAAWAEADRQWSRTACTVAYRARMAIERGRDLRAVRRGSSFAVQLPEAPRFSLVDLVLSYRRIIQEKEAS